MLLDACYLVPVTSKGKSQKLLAAAPLRQVPSQPSVARLSSDDLTIATRLYLAGIPRIVRPDGAAKAIPSIMETRKVQTYIC